jgi:hypothetical protein
MNKQLLFIQSCVRRGVSENDLGYLTKWYFNNLDNEDKFFDLVQDFAKDDFFDNKNKIKFILNEYKPVIVD